VNPADGGVNLMPVPHAVALAVTAGSDLGALRRAPDWPHRDTADVLRPHAHYGGPGAATGTFLICLDRVVVGECGWLGPPDPSGMIEIVYGLAPSARGAGLATEAVQRLCTWVQRQPGVRRMTAEVLLGNEPSRRLLERLGFEDAGPGAGDRRYRRYTRDLHHVDPAAEGRLGCP
jgi:RimJ/RimL family protein N-acetyltransferase